MGRKKGENGGEGGEDELKSPIIIRKRCLRGRHKYTYVEEFGDDDGQVVEGDDSGLVDGSQNDSGLLADEELDIGDDLLEDDRNATNDGADLGLSEVVRTEGLCKVWISLTVFCDFDDKPLTKLLGERGQGRCGASKDLGDALGLVSLHQLSGVGVRSGSCDSRDGTEGEGGEGGDVLEQHGACGGRRRV